MKNFLFAGLAIAALTGLSLPAAADNWVVDFDHDSNGNTIAANSIFANSSNPNGHSNSEYQYYDLAHGGIQNSNNVGMSIGIDSWSWNNPKVNVGVGFDSTPSSGTRDPDLLHPGAGYGNILIIQSSEDSATRGCAGVNPGGTCGAADDEANGGIMTFTFSKAVDLVGMDVFDIEETCGSSTFSCGNKPWYFGKIWFDYDDNDPGFDDYVNIPYTGNGGVTNVAFGNKGKNVLAVHVKCIGSCAIDNITGEGGTTPPPPGVPEPGAMALFGIGMAGIALVRRRRARTA